MEEVELKVFALCDICKEEILAGNDKYEGDHYYDIDGVIICENCIDSYIEREYGHEAREDEEDDEE